MTNFRKGLQEDWYDCSGYGFDYSHVWAGTLTYQLPARLLGFQMIVSRFKKIFFKPKLYGLTYAKIKMPTPYGYFVVNMEENTIEVIAPKEIEIVLEDEGKE